MICDVLWSEGSIDDSIPTIPSYNQSENEDKLDSLDQDLQDIHRENTLLSAFDQNNVLTFSDPQPGTSHGSQTGKKLESEQFKLPQKPCKGSKAKLPLGSLVFGQLSGYEKTPAVLLSEDIDYKVIISFLDEPHTITRIDRKRVTKYRKSRALSILSRPYLRGTTYKTYSQSIDNASRIGLLSFKKRVDIHRSYHCETLPILLAKVAQKKQR